MNLTITKGNQKENNRLFSVQQPTITKDSF